MNTGTIIFNRKSNKRYYCLFEFDFGDKIYESFSFDFNSLFQTVTGKYWKVNLEMFSIKKYKEIKKIFLYFNKKEYSGNVILSSMTSTTDWVTLNLSGVGKLNIKEL